MPTEPHKPSDPAHEDGKMREETFVPRASDDVVLDETARLAREGQREREADEREPDSPKN